MTAGNSDDIAAWMNAVVAFAHRPSRRFYDLATTLSNSPTLQEAALSKLTADTQFSRRTLFYLREVGEFLQKTLLLRDVAERLGWTKLRIIARHAAENDIYGDPDMRSWLSLAETTPARELAKALKGDTGKQRFATVFYLTKTEQARLNKALKAHGATKWRSGLKGKEDALLKLIETPATGKH